MYHRRAASLFYRRLELIARIVRSSCELRLVRVGSDLLKPFSVALTNLGLVSLRIGEHEVLVPVALFLIAAACEVLPTW